MERDAAREQVIECRTQPIDITAARHLPSPSRRLLRRDVAGRANHLATQAHFGIAFEPLDQSEVRHRGLVGTIDEDVRRFQVPMQDPMLVGIVNGFRGALHPLDAPPEIGHPKPGLCDDPGQAWTVHVVHHQVMLALLNAHFVDSNANSSNPTP